QKINIDERILNLQLLNLHEIDSLVDFTALSLKKDKITSFNENVLVERSTKYFRLTTISNYLYWLCKIHLGTSSKKYSNKIVNEFICCLKAKRPRELKAENVNLDKSLTDIQIKKLFEIIKPGASQNPFTVAVQKRNHLIFMLLYHFGLRGGELLNIRISDFDFSSSTLDILRRANDESDTRVRQPLVKTCERRLPIKEELLEEIINYIKTDRKKVKKPNKNDFLFITYKAGLSQSEPLSISSYQKIIYIVSQTTPELNNLTGHMLRHTWNYEFSQAIDKSSEKITEEKETQIRSYLMGWRSGSSTAAIYNKRHLIEKSHKTSLDLQTGLLKGKLQ
ncbi:site-specific integrase, partial [Salmonella enterica]|nr:site-specific integrase [Salmonella enterica]